MDNDKYLNRCAPETLETVACRGLKKLTGFIFSRNVHYLLPLRQQYTLAVLQTNIACLMRVVCDVKSELTSFSKLYQKSIVLLFDFCAFISPFVSQREKFICTDVEIQHYLPEIPAA